MASTMAAMALSTTSTASATPPGKAPAPDGAMAPGQLVCDARTDEDVTEARPLLDGVARAMKARPDLHPGPLIAAARAPRGRR